MYIIHIVTYICVKCPSDKVKENCKTILKVHCVMQLSLSYKVFRWYPEQQAICIASYVASQLPLIWLTQFLALA